MTSAHLHLLLNHLPILGTLFGVLLLISGYVFKSRPIRHAALATLVITALLTIPAYISGEPAERSIKHMQGVNRNMIHEHEVAAKFASIAAYVMGLLAAAALFGSVKEKPYARILTVITLLGGMAVCGMMGRTGYIGGKIRHSELTQEGMNNGIQEGDHGEHGEEGEMEEDD